MSVEAASLFVKTLKARFTQPSELNDPFELRPLIDFKGTAQEFRDMADARMAEMFGTVDGALAVMEKLVATDLSYPKPAVPVQVVRKLIADNPVLGQQFMADMQKHKAELIDSIMKEIAWETLWGKFQQTLGQSVGIFSVTEDPAHTLMWSHYASQHYGVVIEFDENSPWFDQRVTPDDEFRHLVQVTYIQNQHPRTWKQLNGADVLYSKNAEWAYEREWRIIRPLKDGTESSPGKFCFDVPADAVFSIIFGCRTTPILERDIRASVTTSAGLKHVCFKRIKLLDGGRLEVVAAPS